MRIKSLAHPSRTWLIRLRIGRKVVFARVLARVTKKVVADETGEL